MTRNPRTLLIEERLRRGAELAGRCGVATGALAVRFLRRRRRHCRGRGEESALVTGSERRGRLGPSFPTEGARTLDRRDWLILMLGLKGEGDSVALDPVRIQKGMFLFAQTSEVPAGEKYTFKPYHYGPYSSAVRSDLEELVRRGIASAREVPGYSWSRYRLTREGVVRAVELLHQAPGPEARRLLDIKKRVTGKSFNALLRDVYAEYPDFAEKSIFQH